MAAGAAAHVEALALFDIGRGSVRVLVGDVEGLLQLKEQEGGEPEHGHSFSDWELVYIFCPLNC